MPNPVTDEAVEAAAEAAHDAMPWVYGQDDDGEDVYKPWSEAPEAVKQHYRDEILAAAPHLLAVEREARERAEARCAELEAERLTPEEADHILTVYALALEVLRAAGVASPDEPDAALAKLRSRAEQGVQSDA
jgi:hypothetical protein